ncbi:MAG: 50S ribosomal protein L21 [Cytophagales bacterium]|jgi:large subunit ribosomal protein L21|nr:50S ribosomal protein L21 [Cytophagales bacterium]MEC7858210.1 50S ribosomal protein L21 [Bacteroidota bacterium]PDH42380.1 MAG: 50S ribosomal protein L21 [Rhodothermaeota bacterium MED-G19]|tara:strand:+ start:149 stop:457 length:309 start_codon:yes stop_codon:yes gene_type:complete
MYAIVEISGKQFKVEKNKFIYTDKVEPKSGKKVEFDNVLLISDKGKIKLGKPTVKGSKVTGEVLSQLKDDKVIVFKKKRRKGYKVKNGHRQLMTKILIKDIK